jgi:hypothetical protein
MEMEIKVTNLLALINLFPVGCMLGVTKNIYFVEWWPGKILFPDGYCRKRDKDVGILVFNRKHCDKMCQKRYRSSHHLPKS